MTDHTLGHGEKLSRAKDQAIVALLTCPTVTQAAARVGVNEKTLRRWMQDAAFAAAWRLARRQTFEAALGRLQRLAGRAVTTLSRNLKAPRPADQLRAAALILELGR